MKIKGKFYTYVHMRNDDGSVFYVGKGSRDRAWKKDGRGTLWTRIVNKHGYTVHLCGIWDLESDALEHEVRLIDQYKLMGCKIINMTLGGDGVSGYKFSEESKKKMSLNMKTNNHRKGTKASEETRKKMSESMKGSVFTAEHRAKLSAAKAGKKQSLSHRAAQSVARKGHPVSAETREKIAAGRRAYWAIVKQESMSCA